MNSLSCFLQKQWQSLWQDNDYTVLFDALMTHYQQSHRHYHNLTHLHECFAYFDDIKHQLKSPKVVALALFYHDVIYQPKSSSNEQDSANFAKSALSGKVTENELDTIYHYILATQDHKNTLGDGDLDYLLDIDLAILGADWQRFMQYNHQIRQEYSHVHTWFYTLKRRQILKMFYRQSPLFLTPYFYQLLEQKAKANLKHALTT